MMGEPDTLRQHIPDLLPLPPTEGGEFYPPSVEEFALKQLVDGAKAVVQKNRPAVEPGDCHM